MSTQTKDGKQIKITFYSGMIAGIVGKAACHPIDTVRAKIQVSSIKQSGFRSKNLISTMVRDTISSEGFRGLWKGLGVTIIGTGPAYSLYLTSFEYGKHTFKSDKINVNGTNFIAGLFAETVSCLIWLPIDVIKERLQVQSNLKAFKYANTLDAIKQITASEGIVGLYRAYGATVASYGPFSAFYFMFYEKIKTYLQNPEAPRFYESVLASGSAGALAGVIVNPLDIVKLRMQVQRGSKAAHLQEGNFGYRNLFHGLYLIVKNEGFIALTKGSLIKVIYTCPNVAISMGIAEATKAYFLKSKTD